MLRFQRGGDNFIFQILEIKGIGGRVVPVLDLGSSVRVRSIEKDFMRRKANPVPDRRLEPVRLLPAEKKQAVEMAAIRMTARTRFIGTPIPERTPS